MCHLEPSPSWFLLTLYLLQTFCFQTILIEDVINFLQKDVKLLIQLDVIDDLVNFPTLKIFLYFQKNYGSNSLIGKNKPNQTNHFTLTAHCKWWGGFKLLVQVVCVRHPTVA